jgi:hypothetical protein
MFESDLASLKASVALARRAADLADAMLSGFRERAVLLSVLRDPVCGDPGAAAMQDFAAAAAKLDHAVARIALRVYGGSPCVTQEASRA